MLGSLIYATTSLVAAFALGVKYGKSNTDGSIFTALGEAVRDGVDTARAVSRKVRGTPAAPEPDPTPDGAPEVDAPPPPPPPPSGDADAKGGTP